jgi:hypothetical protein
MPLSGISAASCDGLYIARSCLLTVSLIQDPETRGLTGFREEQLVDDNVMCINLVVCQFLD